MIRVIDFVFGVLTGFVLSFTVPSYHDAARDAIAECQKELPRNQYCEVSAKPSIEE
jgi:hypothetical protein